MAQNRIEGLLQAQAKVRAAYRAGHIDDAIREFHAAIAPELGAVDHRVSRCARSMSLSFIRMVDEDPEVIQYLETIRK